MREAEWPEGRRVLMPSGRIGKVLSLRDDGRLEVQYSDLAEEYVAIWPKHVQVLR